MSEEIIIQCAKCDADIGTGDELVGRCCWRCEAGLPPLSKPEPSPPLPPPVPHDCPPTTLNLYRTRWKCSACGRLLGPHEIRDARAA